EFDLVAMSENELARFARSVALVDDVTVLIECGVSRFDDVLILFPGRQVERKRLVARFAIGTHALVCLFDYFLRHVIAGLEFRVATVDDAHEFNHLAVDNSSIRRLDESKWVDTRIARQRRNQSNVRTFRRLDWTNATVVRRVNVADFEARAFAAQTARSQRRETTLVRDLRQRIRLIHELRKL